jgi:hypothetical protein
MKKTLESNRMDKHMTELEQEIRRISEGRDQQISRAMAVLLVSLEIGQNVDHLAQHTGYTREFVGALTSTWKRPGYGRTVCWMIGNGGIPKVN